ncbi:MAG: DNA-binding winged helix-turn-helix (wHTH) protein/TolB-like protein [Phenylobacterium sp.]|jgi:DNA-binding winged helix-turn-helix (wHTH) protein/TolB-like protein/Tfp pilus assembly protein PilF
MTKSTEFTIGEWLVTSQTSEISRHGQVKTLDPRIMALLMFLVEHQGKVISRSELIEQVWQNVLVNDNTINWSIGQLRKALDDQPSQPRYIRTIPKKGYQFIATVEAITIPTPPKPDEETVSQPRRYGLIATVVFSLLVVVAVLVETKTLWPPTPQTNQFNTNSIAVLPFVIHSTDDNLQYFADGIADGLIGSLARNTQLSVAARTSSFAFRQQDVTTREIGKLLGVGLILEGTIYQSDQHIRLTVALISSKNGFQRWQNTIEGNIDNPKQIQSALSKGITDFLGLSHQDDISRINDENYDRYLLATFLLHKRTKSSLTKALELLHQISRETPDYANGFAALAQAHLLAIEYANAPLLPTINKANQAVNQALVLDPANAQAFAARGLMLLYQERFEDAIVALKQAITLNPSLSSAQMWLGAAYKMLGQLNDATTAFTQAVKINPMHGPSNFHLAEVLFLSGQLDKGKARFERALQLDDNIAPLFYAATIHLVQNGYPQQALLTADKLLKRFPDSRNAWLCLAFAHLSVNKGKAKQAFERAMLLPRASTMPHYLELLLSAIFDHPIQADDVTAITEAPPIESEVLHRQAWLGVTYAIGSQPDQAQVLLQPVLASKLSLLFPPQDYLLFASHLLAIYQTRESQSQQEKQQLNQLVEQLTGRMSYWQNQGYDFPYYDFNQRVIELLLAPEKNRNSSALSSMVGNWRLEEDPVVGFY